jgi:hypothetical protein
MLRRPARSNPGRQQVSRGKSLPAPVGGWDAVSPIADMPEDRAVALENWFPSTGDVRVRRGHIEHCDGMGSSVVDTLMVYNGLTVASSAMFAVTDGTIYDVSASGAASATTETVANNRWQYVNFTTSGGKFLWCCNGTDNPLHYNGSVWAEPAITGITASDIINVNGHKNRLWFVLKDSTKAAYLATGAVAGAATTFELGGLFTRGGYLVAMATWTRDGGAGTDDLGVFISSRGQAAVYAGTDPSSASTWELIGVYDVGPPIGYRCFTKVGAELMLLNLDGVLPLSKGLVLDRAAQSQVTITLNINNAINEYARLYKDNFGWELVPYAKGTMAILNVPVQEGVNQIQPVMNTITGAWCKFTGLNANTWAVFKDGLYFGGNDGIVYQADTGAIDVETPIDAIGQSAYNYYDMKGRLKQWKLIQPLLTTDSDNRPAIGISTDYRDNATLGTPSSTASVSALYDVAVYDTDVYAVEGRTVADWTSIAGVGQCAAIHFRARTGDVGSTGDVIMRLNGFNVIFEPGGFL